jgi:hypothetical protein
VLRLAENLRPAGGYAARVEAFLDCGNGFAWITDDDFVPASDALACQLTNASQQRVVIASMLDSVSGAVRNTQGWYAVLVPRDVVAAVRVPDPALFWWTEDTEYLQWRIPRAGHEVDRCQRARVEVNRVRSGRANRHGSTTTRHAIRCITGSIPSGLAVKSTCRAT